MASERTEQQLEGDESFLAGPFPVKHDVLACQCSRWYPIFSNLPRTEPDHANIQEAPARSKRDKHRSNVTLKSKILRPLPDEFEEYLLSDGIHLPRGATNLSSCCINEPRGSSQAGNRKQGGDDDSDVWSSDSNAEHELDKNGEDGSDSDNLHQRKTFDLAQLSRQLEQAIQDLGGSVLPKLNWSAPKDATWMLGTSNTSLKCKTPGDIYLLIKSSDFCLHDALHALEDSRESIPTNASDGQYELELVLKQWVSLWYPSMEFRCFVYDNALVAISQRNHTQYYPHLGTDFDDWIGMVLVDFWESSVREIVQHPPMQLSAYVLDVYIDSKRRVWIVDFNPWSYKTDALLWTWPELLQLADTFARSTTPSPPGSDRTSTQDENYIQYCPPFPEIRLVETPNQIRPDPLASYRAPIDTLHIASLTSSSAPVSHTDDAKALSDFLASCKRPSGTGPSSLIVE